MCGINGFNFVDERQVELMNKSIKHRGPDDEGIFTDVNVTLGHVRLSILDLSRAGRQPMIYDHNGKTAVLVFNGEIYNFLEIREILQKKGYVFNSRTDSEVLLASYLEWGFECVKYFNGMWAFVIYDPAKKIFFCSRDRLGKKPLYYFFDKNKFIFSSELKGILTHQDLSLSEIRNIDRDAVDLYFALGFVPSPYTIYKNTFKLEPRQNLIFELGAKRIRKWHYYEIPKYEPTHDLRKLVKEGTELLKDSVRLRMIADVPVGALLSGGLDSSTIVGVMKELTDPKNLHTFSIGFEGEYDETPFINIVKEYFGTHHHHYYFTQRDFEDLIPTYAYIYDEPLCDPAGFPTYKVSKMAKEYVTVVLSGDGGDEIFGGYPEHVMGYRMTLIRRIPKPLRIVFSKIPARENLDGYASLFLLKKAFGLSLHDQALFYAKAMENEILIPTICKDWTTEKLRSCLLLNNENFAETLRLYDLSFNTLPDNFLAKLDRASMANALEARSPFLDYRFVEFSQKIPAEWKVDLFHTKKLMRKMIKHILPAEIVHRRKKGFVLPLQKWILDQNYEQSLKNSLKTLKDLNPSWYQFFEKKAMRKSNKLYGTYKIRLFLFSEWINTWIK
jgi:asparagine synthase (glutamine-hydrolysing)